MNNLLDFLENWFAKNGIIEETDTVKLSNFMKELGAEIDKLSIEPPEGSEALVLYSGYIQEVPMWKIAQGASQSGQKYYYISDTEAGKVLNNSEFSDILKKICNQNDNMYNRIMGNQIDGQVRSSYVVDGQLSVNDRISNRIAQNASGDVNIWAPYGATNTVLTDTELRAVLTNEKITSINGVPKGTFINEYLRYANIDNFPFDAPESLNTNALYSVFDSIKDSVSEDFFDKAQIYYNNAGKVVFVDTTPMFGGTLNMSEDINYSFSTTIGDRRQYASADYLASICSEYNNLTDLQKLQIGQLELNGRNHNFTDMHMLFQGSSTGSTGNVRIAFDINGNVMAIDASALTIEIENSLEKYSLSAEYQNLIAPVSGYINSIEVNTIGELVSAGQDIITIVPKDVPLEVVCYVANMDIADIEVGMDAEMKLEAYPYNSYGTVKVCVKYISPSAFISEQMGSVYLVKLEITEINEAVDVISGLSGTVEIKTGERTILEYFMAPILKGFNESLHEK